MNNSSDFIFTVMSRKGGRSGKKIGICNVSLTEGKERK